MIRRKTMASKPLCRLDPSPRSFAADAHDCIMVTILTDRPNTRLWRVLRPLASSPRNCRRLPELEARPTHLACRRARDRQGQVASRWPAATLDRHCARRPIKAQVGTRRWSRKCGRTRRWNDLKIRLDNNRPIQGLTPASRVAGGKDIPKLTAEVVP